jgi:tetratricopeptide (TPR) repeat protein
VGELLTSIADVHERCGEWTEALACLAEALEVYKRLYKGEHACVASVLQRMGGVHESCGAYGKALECFKLALDIRQKQVECLMSGGGTVAGAIGSVEAAVAESEQGLGGVYYKLADFGLSSKYLNQSFEIYKRALAVNTSELADSLKKIGLAYKNLGNYVQFLNSRFFLKSILIEAISFLELN